MGGEREKVLDMGMDRPEPVDRPSLDVTLGGSKRPIRVHENKGEVHFHDDKGGNKVAVKTDLFYKRWTEFQQRMFDPNAKLTFYDESRQTIAVIAPELLTIRGVTKAHVQIRLEKVEISPALGDLIDFSAGK